MHINHRVSEIWKTNHCTTHVLNYLMFLDQVKSLIYQTFLSKMPKMGILNFLFIAI